MFINAQPRTVSNGFQTFVHTQKVESLHQRLVEMSNNDVKAWGIFRSVAPSSTTDSWDYHMDDLSGNENFQVSYAIGKVNLEGADINLAAKPIWWVSPRYAFCFPDHSRYSI